MRTKDLYDQYHVNRKPQKSILNTRNFTYRVILEQLNKYTNTSKKILDVGCGTGSLDFYLASKGIEVTGIDISILAINAAIQSAKKLGLDKKTTFLVSKFPEESIDGPYDMVICCEVLEHLKKDKMAVARIYKLLKKNGIAIFSSPSKNSVFYRMGLNKNFDKRVGHRRRYSALTYENLIKSANFEVLSVIRQQGIIRDLLFTRSVGNIFIRIANRLGFVSDLLTYIDNMSLVFGESGLMIVARR